MFGGVGFSAHYGKKQSTGTSRTGAALAPSLAPKWCKLRDIGPTAGGAENLPWIASRPHGRWGKSRSFMGFLLRIPGGG